MADIPGKTLDQIAFDEQQDRIAAMDDAGLPHTTANSNRPRVNNTDATSMDSQGLAGSLDRRKVADVSFNMGTPQAYEEYVNDALGLVEAKKNSGASGATPFADERPFPTNGHTTEPNR